MTLDEAIEAATDQGAARYYTTNKISSEIRYCMYEVLYDATDHLVVKLVEHATEKVILPIAAIINRAMYDHIEEVCLTKSIRQGI